MCNTSTETPDLSVDEISSSPMVIVTLVWLKLTRIITRLMSSLSGRFSFCGALPLKVVTVSLKGQSTLSPSSHSYLYGCILSHCHLSHNTATTPPPSVALHHITSLCHTLPNHHSLPHSFGYTLSLCHQSSSHYNANSLCHKRNTHEAVLLFDMHVFKIFFFSSGQGKQKSA